MLTGSPQYIHSERPRIIDLGPTELCASSRHGKTSLNSKSVPSEIAGQASVTPRTVLATYLDINEASRKSIFWRYNRNALDWDSLPAILVHYLHTSQLPEVLALNEMLFQTSLMYGRFIGINGIIKLEEWP